MNAHLVRCTLGCLAISPLLGAEPLTLHVAVDGANTNPGSADRPFQSLERARDEIRSLRQRGALPADGVHVAVHPGTYPVTRTFTLTEADSGTAESPIVYRSADPDAHTPRFHGGVRLRDFDAVTERTVLERLPDSSRNRVLAIDLVAAGVTEIPTLELGGFGSGRGFRTYPTMELFVDEEPMQLARWPNDRFVMTGPVPGPLTLQAWDRKPGTPEGRFKFPHDRLSRWAGEPDAWLYGYWFWDWADSYEKIERIDLDRQEITLAKPWHGYGYRENQRFYGVNLLCELDTPGEWYLDRERRKVYLFPKAPVENARVELSVVAAPLVHVDGASFVQFQGLLWECGAADGVRITGGQSVHLEGCTIRKMAGNGIEIRGGNRHRIQSGDIHNLGRGGVVAAGGNRKTLLPGNHRIENCHIHHLSRIDHTYTPAIWLDGVGHQVQHNLIHHVASSALRVEGNEHLVEFNEAHRVLLESDDQGAVDMYGNPTYRGNVYRFNYWHHLGDWDAPGAAPHTQRAGIRLDDAICGTRIEGNIFQRCSTGKTHFGGVQIHGGKENLIEANLFVDTAAAVSFTPWGDKRWREFTANALAAEAIDPELYLKRYPQLAELPERHDRNVVRRNVALRCPTLFLRAPTGTDASDNREFPDNNELREGPDGRLEWSADDARRLGVDHIPFEKIGLYRDAWRRHLETRLTK
jgi:hypothetical protein